MELSIWNVIHFKFYYSKIPDMEIFREFNIYSENISITTICPDADAYCGGRKNETIQNGAVFEVEN